MEIYILRHGIAIERDPRSKERDSERPLTPEGRKKMRSIAKAMRAMGLTFNLILSSPYARALQTAEIVTEVLRNKKKLRLSEHLTVNGSAEDLVDEVRSLSRTSHSLLLVGHEPYLTRLISVLLTGEPDLRLVLKKGGLCKLDVGKLHYGPCARLEWLLAPRHL